MSNVVKFPCKDPAAGFVKQLHTRMKELDALYDRLEAQHHELNALERNAAELEASFDDVLTQYAGLVGGENLEVEMLRYSQNTKAVSDENGKTWHMEWKDED